MKLEQCVFARDFPKKVATFLEVGETRTRRIREETITDLLLCELSLLKLPHLKVDFPIAEHKTGQDMDWEFFAPYAPLGPKYLKLHIQAKRAIVSTTKQPYWYYRELDHEVPKGAGHGTQHQMLLKEAFAQPDCIPLYMFYHPQRAVSNEKGKPNVEGVNVMRADCLPINVTSGHWEVEVKKIEKWRAKFLPLSALLCAFYNRKIQKSIHQSFNMSSFSTPTPIEIINRLKLDGRDFERMGSTTATPYEVFEKFGMQSDQLLERPTIKVLSEFGKG